MTTTNRLPLNGTKTHPLTKDGIAALQLLSRNGPQIPQRFNPGIRNRLLREDLVRVIQMMSPHKKDKGGLCDHFALTDAGVEALNVAMESSK